MNAVKVLIKRLDEDIQLPSYAHVGDSGMDLRSTIDFELKPFERRLIPCGFAIALPEGYGGFVLPRSGLASKQGVTVVNAPGLIDSNYRGQIMVALINLDPNEAFSAKRGDRIAQLVISPTPAILFESVESLDDTTRGSGGFGSSGTA